MKVTVRLDMMARHILRYIQSFKDKMTRLESFAKDKQSSSPCEDKVKDMEIHCFVEWLTNITPLNFFGIDRSIHSLCSI